MVFGGRRCTLMWNLSTNAMLCISYLIVPLPASAPSRLSASEYPDTSSDAICYGDLGRSDVIKKDFKEV